MAIVVTPSIDVGMLMSRSNSLFPQSATLEQRCRDLTDDNMAGRLEQVFEGLEDPRVVIDDARQVMLRPGRA